MSRRAGLGAALVVAAGPGAVQGWGPGGWLMGGGSMMGCGPGVRSGAVAGPSHGWAGAGPITLEQARTQALIWVSRYASGATVDAGFAMPMGYRFTATQNGSVVAVIMVNDDTGAVWGRMWTAPAAASS